ncbi:hypothetical protein SAMN05720354_103180 [Nitrosospira sp. Nsp1]|nr:hypothetical protein SAMN05720354_103180 [Nitrosospira sp. Nsp1]
MPANCLFAVRAKQLSLLREKHTFQAKLLSALVCIRDVAETARGVWGAMGQKIRSVVRYCIFPTRSSGSDFKGCHFLGEIILSCIRWHCKYGISYPESGSCPLIYQLSTITKKDFSCPVSFTFLVSSLRTFIALFQFLLRFFDYPQFVKQLFQS